MATLRLQVLSLLRRLLLYSGQSWRNVLRSLGRLIERLLSNPYIGDLWRFIFFGSLVETGRVISQKASNVVSNFFVTTASFSSGDFAYDWVKAYLESYHLWDQSRSFNVVARNTALIPNASSSLGSTDGHPDPVYEPSDEAPEIFKWRGYWTYVTKGLQSEHSTTEILVLRMWSYNRNVLNDFVCTAREFYINSSIPPRRIESHNSDSSGSLLKAHFRQGDISYDWMLAYLRSENVLNDVMEFSISTKQSDISWGGSPKDAVRFPPAEHIQQMFQYHSTQTGRKAWLQVTLSQSYDSWDTPGRHAPPSGGTIDITLHTSHKAILAELIDDARVHYQRTSVFRVTLHMTDGYSWTKTMSKSRRPLSTLILPDDVKETLLADLREFLDSEEWYNLVGVPHRRGYLLYGKPGTGKTSTIHAIAGELGLEIYAICLSDPNIDDHSLARVISDTPARCILLLEDLDCAFPYSRDDDLDDEEETDSYGRLVPRPMVARSRVTLSGLLNVLDSMSSEEGRVTFATTNHIENLDPALIRPGRMDVKIPYHLATTKQTELVFKRFYPAERFAYQQRQDGFSGNEVLPPVLESKRCYTTEKLDILAFEFAELMTDETFSVAELQGYLLTKKWDPQGAVDNLSKWIKDHEDEKARIVAAKQKRILAAQKRRVAKELPVQDGNSGVQSGEDVVN